MTSDPNVPAEKSGRLNGHALLREGAPVDERGHFVNGYGGVGGHGRARCTCGQMSDPLSSGAARKAWHRTHKADLAAAPVPTPTP